MFTARNGMRATAISAKDSCISELPGPVEAIIARAPVAAAPHTMPIASSSDSAFMHTPPACGRRHDMYSRISVDGVIGDPAEKRTPARTAASASAGAPSISAALMCAPSVAPRSCARLAIDDEAEVRTDQRAALAAGATVVQLGVVKAELVHRARYHQHLGRADLHAQVAAFAALDRDLDDASHTRAPIASAPRAI